MGIVHRALEMATGRMAAIKTPRRAAPAASAILRSEAETLKRLDHPGIVRLLADGVTDGIPWMAMELLEGRTLSDEIEAIWAPVGDRRARTSSGWFTDETPTAPARAAMRRPLPSRRPGDAARGAAANRLGEIAAIVVQVATILEHLHGRGLVHRDVKPANVFLRGGAGHERVSLLDFGLACGTNTIPFGESSSLCVGTMHYAAPEQIIGDPVDGRADIYALGCVLYELVTVECPFDGASNDELAQKHLHAEPRRPSLLVSGLPWPIEELVMEMLAKDPAKRPASAADAGARLARAVARADVRR